MTAPSSSERSHDGLVPVGYRFPLSRGAPEPHPGDDVSGSAPEPFGMRFFRSAGEVPRTVPFPYRYDPGLQLAVTDDGVGRPLIELPVAWDKTTTGSADGRDPNVEEHKMDYAGDSRS